MRSFSAAAAISLLFLGSSSALHVKESALRSQNTVLTKLVPPVHRNDSPTALRLRGGELSDTGPRVCAGILAFMTLGLAIPYVFFPRYQLTEVFGFKGEVSALAAHCLTVIGAEAMSVIALLLCATCTPSKQAREVLLGCFLIQVPFQIFAQVKRPFLPLAEAMQGPIIVNVLQAVLAISGIVMGRI